MDKNEPNIIMLKLKGFNLFYIRIKLFFKKRIIKLSDNIKRNKKILVNKNNNGKVTFKYVEKYKSTLFKKLEKLFLLYFFNFILLNINRILCNSFIIVKINKSGNRNIFFNEGIDGQNLCSNNFIHIPNSMTINDELIDPPVGKYLLNTQTNTIKLYYDELKTSYQCLFFGCSDIDEIDASNLDTSNAISMKYMFAFCSSLSSLNLLNINTSKVEDMENLFNGCTSLTILDLSGFDTSSVTKFYNMFQSCKSLVSLNLSNFNTKKGKEMHGMFYQCFALRYLDIHSFDISSAPSMAYMFYDCRSLESLDISNFNTNNINNMVNMFRNCISLTTLDLSHFDTNLVIEMSNMFYSCKKLVSLNLSNFNTGNVDKMEQMFYECNKLESLDVSSFRTSKVTSMFKMFANCNSLTALDLSGFTSSVFVNMGQMFLNNKKLISIDLSNIDFSGVTNINNIFSGCSNLKYINLKSLIINDNFQYTYLIDNSLINPIICIDNEESFDKIVSLYECKYSDTSENWGEYKDIISSNNNNKYINGCLLSKYNSNSNCYQICSFYYYFDENTNKYLCTESLKCPEPYDKLIYGKNECINSCNKTQNNKYELILGKICLSTFSNNLYMPNDKSVNCIPKCPEDRPFLLIDLLECVSNCTIAQRQNRLCVTYYIFSKEVNYQIFDEVIRQTRNELTNDYDSSVINGGLINENGDIITITRTKKIIQMIMTYILMNVKIN